MLRNSFLFAGALAVATLFAIGCGSDSPASSGTSNTSGGEGGSGAGGGGVQPPGPPTNGKPGDGNGTVFGISKLYLGDIDPNTGVADAFAWKKIGYDLDHVVTDCVGNACGSVQQCRLVSGAMTDTAADGDNGIDNSFGHKILPIIQGFGATAAVNDALAQGTFTIMIDVEKLGADANYTGLLSKLYAGGNLGHTPKYDGTDAFPILPELLTNPSDPGSSKVQFKSSYVNDNVWVSGSAGTVALQLNVKGYALTLNIQHALVSFEMSADHKSASKGVVAGVLNTQDLISELKKVIGGFSSSLCSGSTLEGVLQTIERASDIMDDGSTGVPTTECNGISIGIGFDAQVVKLGPVADPSPPAGDPCKGTGGGGGGG